MQETKPKVAIYGAGSLGTVLGAFISRSGKDVVLINHNKAHVEALRKKGARIVGTVEMTQSVTAILPEEMEGNYDIIFLLTKQQRNPEVVRFLKAFLAPDGVMVTLQNGLPEDGIAEILGSDRVLGCTVAWGATLKEPGVSELTSSPDSLSFSLGAISEPAHPLLPVVKEYLETMGTVTVEKNFIGSRWSKLLINSAFSGILTLSMRHPFLFSQSLVSIR